MKNTLGWCVPGTTFEDGSKLEDWVKIYESGQWHWQYDTHELNFDVYQHDGQFWKLYRIRTVPFGGSEYTYEFGGVACRMSLVKYKFKTRSPHSSRLMVQDDQEWVRVYEVDSSIHTVIRTGRADQKYDGAQ